MAIWKKVHVNKEVREWEGDFPVYYIYTVGKAGERFFSTLKEKGTFTAGKCPSCGKVYLPPRIYCEKCMEEIEDLVEVEPEGEVVTYTVVYRDSKGETLSSPEIIAFIKIGGTEGGIVHKIIANPDEIKDICGKRVKAKLKAPQEREGNLKDIIGFELIS